MKHIFKIGTLVIGGLLATVSCDDFVDIDPQYTQDRDNYFLSAGDYQRALIGAYDLMQTSYLDLWIGEVASDNSIAGGESVTDTQGLHQIDEMKHGGVNMELRGLWRFMYAGVTRVNLIFANKDKIEFDDKPRIMAEASFLRAYYYFELVKFFGGVPLIIDKNIEPGDVSSIPRATAAEVYTQIETDLTAAIEVLEWDVAVKGRINKGAALALLGKVYLYQNKFAESAAALDRVITEGQYDLFNNFETMFRVANESSPETVFDIQYVGSEGGSYGCLVCLEGFAAVGFHGIRGYKGPIYGDGNSYNLPTQDLVEAFEDGDPRLGFSVLDIEAFKAEQTEAVEYVKGVGGHTGYYNKKYLKRMDELGPGDNDLTSPVNHKVIRFADVLLMAAEAHNRKPAADDAKALEYLNRVRTRPSVDMPELSVTGTALTDAIYHERRVEFAGEGLRFFDLVRTGKAADEIEGFVVGKHELFPIPQDEIDLSGAGWLQNPKY
jgi:starch-binding outer membrane protein, SusD/RagB family